MKKAFLFLYLTMSALIGSALIRANIAEEDILSYTVHPKKEQIHFYWKDDNGHPLGSLGELKEYLGHRHQLLLFATNGGMFKSDQSPVGLFIQDYKIQQRLDTSSGEGNFYLKPNGVFYLTKDGKAFIRNTTGFVYNDKIRYATQSGPMLLINGVIHPAFKKGSANLNIRNGVGILPDGRVVFAMSKTRISFYDFADYFKKLGCKDALYLDGFVSRTYLPAQQWEQTDGNFGVIIGISAPLM